MFVKFYEYCHILLTYGFPYKSLQGKHLGHQIHVEITIY